MNDEDENQEQDEGTIDAKHWRETQDISLAGGRTLAVLHHALDVVDHNLDK